MRLVAGVSGPAEARLALDNGADAVELRDAAALAETLPVAGDRNRVRAAAGRLPAEPGAALAHLRPLLAAGAVSAGLPLDAPRETLEALLAALKPLGAETRLLAVLHPELHLSILGALKAAGFAGAILAPSAGERVVDRSSAGDRERFVSACRNLELEVGFAGGLEEPDVARLAPLRPDCLTVRAALTAGGGPDDPVEGGRVFAFARLVREAGTLSVPVTGAPTDRLFVRDLVVEMEVGAYAAERGRRQRVRFTAEVDVKRAAAVPGSMADIYSYDVIVDAVRALVARGHTAFVETLAEELAATLLADGRVRGVLVRVEKLDLGPAAAGIEIRRESPARTAG